MESALYVSLSQQSIGYGSTTDTGSGMTAMDEIAKFITSFIQDPETAILLISFGLAIFAFWKGMVVPKFIYDSSEMRRVAAEKSLAETTEVLRDLTTEIRQRARN
jgi:hypothetical protein